MFKFASVLLLSFAVFMAGCSGGGSASPRGVDSNVTLPRSTAPASSAPTEEPTAAPEVSQPAANLENEEFLGAVLEPPRQISDFTMISTTGEPFTLSEHRGETILLYFGYRACPDFCPTTFAELRRLYLEMGEPADDLKVVFVTVDPERDTMDLLTPFVGAFHEDFIGIRDDGETLEKLMREFGITAEKQQLGDSELSYLVDHTVSVFLIAPDGRLTVQYLFGTDYRDIMHDVELIRQS